MKPMNPDENNPNHFSSDDEPNFIQMPYPVHIPSLWSEQESSSRNYIRPIIAIFMVLLLILSISYTTLQSMLLDQDTNIQNVNTNFDIVLTGLSTTTTDCQEAPHVTLGGTYSRSRRLCICGSLYTEESAVNYVLRLRDVQGNILEQTEKLNQNGGSFCHLWELSNIVEEGRYAIEVAANRQSAVMETIWMTIVTQLLYHHAQSSSSNSMRAASSSSAVNPFSSSL
jgi:hypothetical protein